MLQITITDPTQAERETLRELLDHWPLCDVLADVTSIVEQAPPPSNDSVTEDEPTFPPIEQDPPSTIKGPSAPIQDELINVPLPPAVELDKEGNPWDEKIHSSNRQLTQEGVWRKRRGSAPPEPTSANPKPMGPFIALVGRVMAAIGDKTITQAQVDAALTQHGVTSLPVLGQHPELVDKVEGVLFP